MIQAERKSTQDETPPTGRRTAINLGAQFISMLGRQGSMALVSILAARLLGVTNYGQFSAVTSFVLLFRFVADWGLQRLVIREVSRNQKAVHRYVSASLLVLFFANILAIGLIYIAGHIFPISDGNLGLLLLASLWLVIGEAGMFFSGVFMAFERMEFDSLATLAEIIATAIFLSFVFILQIRSLEILMAVLLAARMINLLVCIYIYRRYIGTFAPPADLSLSFSIIRATLPFGLQILLAEPANLLVVFTNQFQGDLATGYFKAALTISLLPTMIAAIFANVYYPKMSRAYPESPSAFRQLLQKNIHYMLLIGLPIQAGLWLLAEPIAVFLYGPGFEASAPFIRLLSLTTLIGFVREALANGLTSANRQGQRTAVQAVGMAIAAVIGLVWIPSAGGYGASHALNLVRLAMLLLFAIISYKTLVGLGQSGWIYPLRLTLPMIFACLVMVGFIISSENLHVLIQIAIAGSLYGAILLVCDPMIKQDIRGMNIPSFIQSIWQKRLKSR
ncbi:MAG: flippase [Anaerolineales bacterium]|nr:flippase [Anaerolineales bacterium]